MPEGLIENVPPFAILEDNLLLSIVNPPIVPLTAAKLVAYRLSTSIMDVFTYPLTITVAEVKACIMLASLLHAGRLLTASCADPAVVTALAAFDMAVAAS